jgi:hypothetical protein
MNIFYCCTRNFQMMGTITGLPQCSIAQALLVDSNKILILIVILKLLASYVNKKATV